MGNTAPKADKKDAMVALGSLLKEMDLLHDPSSAVTSVAEDVEHGQDWLGCLKPKRVETQSNYSGSWMLRLRLHHEWMTDCLKHYNVDMKDLELFIFILLIQKRSVKKRREVYFYCAEGLEQESTFIGIRVKEGRAGPQSSRRRLKKARQVIHQQVVESLVCQVSSVLWPRMPRTIDGRTRTRSNHTKQIDWGLFQRRLETNPEEAMHPEVVSTIRAGDKYPSILHAICSQRMSYDVPVPLTVLETLIKAYPKALSTKSKDYFDFMPLHHVLTFIADGTSALGVKHVKKLIAAYPEALFHDDTTDELPIHIICDYPTAFWMRDGGIFSEQRLETLQACIKLILEASGDSCLLYYKRIMTNFASGYPHHRPRLKKAVVDSYLSFLRAIAAGQCGMSDAVDEWMLHIALDRTLCGNNVGIFADLLDRLSPSAFRKVSCEGLLPLHVAIQKHQECGRNDYFRRIVLSIIRAQPRALHCREIQHGLYPFALAAMGEKSESDKVYTLLRSDPTVLLSRESRQHT